MYTLQAVFGATARRKGVSAELNLFVTLVTAPDWLLTVKLCTLIQALRLCTGRTAYRGSRGVALLLLDHATWKGWEVSVTPWPLFTPMKRPGTHCTGGWVGPRVDLDRWVISCRTGTRSRDRSARRQSLYRLSYPGPQLLSVTQLNSNTKHWGVKTHIKVKIKINFTL